MRWRTGLRVLRRFGRLTSESVMAFVEDNAMLRGAAIAYYAIFSLAPILVIAVAIAGYVFGTERAQAEVAEQTELVVGTQAAELIASMLNSASHFGSGLVATTISLVGILVTSSGMFGAVESSLNDILQVPPAASTWWATIRTRLMGLLLVGAVGFLLITLLIANAVLEKVKVYLGMLPNTQLLVDLANFGLSFTMLALAVGVLFRVLPNRWLSWGEIAVGALVTAALLLVGRYGISLYMSQAGVASSYGAAGTVFVVLLWIYYSTLIFLFGAECVKVYARHTSGGHIQQKELGEMAPDEKPEEGCLGSVTGELGRRVLSPGEAEQARTTQETALREEVA
ncbi:YihY/virulence factor BrkB family protein [Roseomonas elaeocarpi]|uniref:YihY/virulence factor BrkB family protein n=1 Tax=Roseomonas elaeocarpi TaxID=907779 RepID=A0ABV6JPG6_9PROT